MTEDAGVVIDKGDIHPMRFDSESEEHVSEEVEENVGDIKYLVGGIMVTGDINFT